MNFFKSFFAALLALVVFSILAVVVLTSILAGLASQEQTVVKDNSILHLKLDRPIAEVASEDPFDGMFGPSTSAIGLLQLKDVLAHAKDDNKIKGIFLDVSYPQAGFATLEEIRESLLDFRESGKWVVAYTETLSEGAYYLATAADKIYLYPEGEVEFNGLTVEVSFFKRLFEKLEIRPEVFRVGEFKSAVEPFLLDKMSPENRLQLTELTNSIYDHMLTRIAEARNIPREKLEEISDKMLIRNARLAKEYGLVDSLIYEDQFRAALRNRMGLKETDKIPTVKYGKYRDSYSTSSSSGNEIAVIVAEGTITPGSSDGQDGVIGADTFVEALRKAREDKDIKAIVLRINSPGGEFRSSDRMWREVQLATEVKPVIASMSDYAASGGYYMAMGCDTIVAQPHTITGSIGIFGMMFDMSGFLGNKLGITFDEVKTGEFGEMYTVTRPLNEAEKNFWQHNLEEHYETFTGKAADGRGVTIDEIKKVASGRVWTGSQAKERKLVDITGGFNDAVRIAAEKAKVGDDYKVRFYPKKKSFITQFLEQREESAKVEVLKSTLGEHYTWYQQLERIKTYQGTQARLPFELQIH